MRKAHALPAAFLLAALVAAPLVGVVEEALPFPIIEKFESFGMADGLPAWKVHCVLADGGRVWAGTTQGLVLRENGKFRVIGTEQGLSNRIVTTLAVDPATGDLWAGTFKGLNRISAGRVDTFTQVSSGLPNDVIYSVLVAKGAVWVATAAGVGRYDLGTRAWSLFDQTNSIMHEPWTYSMAESKDRIWVGAWAGGVLEHDPVKGTWKEWRDPDGEMEIDLQPDDGPVHDVTSWIATSGNLLWQASYFGMARYDGKSWKTYHKEKTPLVSDFINFIAAKGDTAWVCTDQGLSVTDGATWATYRIAKGSGGTLALVRPGRAPETRKTATALPNEFVLGASLTENEVWLATSHGLARGVFARGRK